MTSECPESWFMNESFWFVAKFNISEPQAAERTDIFQSNAVTG